MTARPRHGSGIGARPRAYKTFFILLIFFYIYFLKNNINPLRSGINILVFVFGVSYQHY